MNTKQLAALLTTGVSVSVLLVYHVWQGDGGLIHSILAVVILGVLFMYSSGSHPRADKRSAVSLALGILTIIAILAMGITYLQRSMYERVDLREHPGSVTVDGLIVYRGRPPHLDISDLVLMRNALGRWKFKGALRGAVAQPDTKLTFRLRAVTDPFAGAAGVDSIVVTTTLSARPDKEGSRLFEVIMRNPWGSDAANYTNRFTYSLQEVTYTR